MILNALFKTSIEPVVRPASDSVFHLVIVFESKLSTQSPNEKPVSSGMKRVPFVTPTGFKPVTAGAEIQCAIQLRHGAFLTSGANPINGCATEPFISDTKLEVFVESQCIL